MKNPNNVISFPPKTKSLNLHKITLQFQEKDIETKFKKEFYSKSIQPFRLSFIIVILLYAAFGFLDYTTSEHFYKAFFIVRYYIVLPIILSVLLFSFHRYFAKIWQVLLSICFVIGGSGIIYMLLMNPNSIFYYGGIFLILLAGYFFIKLRFLAAAISGILLLLIYNIGAIAFQIHFDNQYQYLLITNAFYISANIISMLALYNIEFLERKEFYQKILLSQSQDEIAKINESLEAKVKERTDQLDKRNISLTNEINTRKRIEENLIIAKEKAEESDRLKTAFLHNISHEIRTPMNGIIGFTNLLLKPGFNREEYHNFVEIIQMSSDRMINTVDSIMDISMIESKQVKVSISKTKIKEQIESIYTHYKPEANKKGIGLILNESYLAIDAVINTDSEKVYSIITNLVKNAIKYSHEGVIEFGFNKKGKNLEFCIKDSGIGIPENRLEAIFDRFVQADIEDKHVYEGCGLGLSISKAYIEMLGGEIWVKSTEGAGSQFYFTIPYDVTKIEITNDKLIEPDQNPEVQIKNLKILIAEDEPIVNEYLKIILEKISSTILYAKTGIETVDMYKENPDIDLIIMDIKMPGINGYEATRQIRKYNQNVTIIAQTAYVLDGNREKAIEAGCDDYIRKPFNKHKLMEMITKHMSKK